MNRYQIAVVSPAGSTIAFALCAFACFGSAPAFAAPKAVQAQSPMQVAAPGSLLRWSAPGATTCRVGKHAWVPLGETCYFPIDILQKPGPMTVSVVAGGRAESARIRIEPFDYGTEEVNLGDIPQRDPSPADMKRSAREGVTLAKVFQRRESPPQFTLPLGPPAKPMPAGKAFGVNRVFNGKPATQPHMGTDYAAGPGTPVLAVADGTVALAQDLFYPGNAVLVDHGNGLVSESFHLAEISVAPGQHVAKGDVLGKVGSTGRSTGPHLYFGVRWHGARIDPKYLFENPTKIPAIK